MSFHLLRTLRSGSLQLELFSLLVRYGIPIGPPTELDISSSYRNFDFLVFFRYFREYFTNLSNLFTEITKILLIFTNLSDLFSKILLILVICLVKFH